MRLARVAGANIRLGLEVQRELVPVRAVVSIEGIESLLRLIAIVHEISDEPHGG